MNPVLQTELAERIAIALECLANYQQRALDISQRMADQQQQALAFAEQSAMASERMCIIAEYQLNDYQQSRGGTHDRE